MIFNSLTRNALRAVLLCTLSFAFSLTLSPPARAQSNDSNATRESEAFERGKQQLSQGDAAGASESLKRVANARKKDADAWYLLGIALSHAGKHKDARKAFETTLK